MKQAIAEARDLAGASLDVFDSLVLRHRFYRFCLIADGTWSPDRETRVLDIYEARVIPKLRRFLEPKASDADVPTTGEGSGND